MFEIGMPGLVVIGGNTKHARYEGGNAKIHMNASETS